MNVELLETQELMSWVLNDSFEGFNTTWYNYIHTLGCNYQRLCIRKIIEAHRLGYIIISEPKIEFILNNHYNSISIDSYIILQCIQSVLKSNRLPYTMELFNTIRNIYNGIDSDSVVDLFHIIENSNLFNHCSGYSYISRYEINYDKDGFKSTFDFDGYNEHSADKKSHWYRIRGTIRVNQKDLSSILTLNYDKDSKDVISLLKRMISRREYDKERREWFFPAGTMNDVVCFLREATKHKQFFEIELYDKKQNSLPTWRSVVMRHSSDKRFCFCEGKKWNYPYLGDCYWCNGHACFCDGIAMQNSYKNYSLFDIINIIGGNSLSQQTMQVVYSAYNRLVDLIEHKHLFCKSCEQTLEPKSEKGYNARRVIWFRCANTQCDQYQKDIYLNHCFQNNCGNIIDSRETMRCSNGFYICSECGACCAESQYERKKNANIPLNPYISDLIEYRKMHLDGGDRPIFFCHKCGKQLEYKVFSEPLNINGKKVYGYSQCPDHNEHLVVFPYINGGKKFVKKFLESQDQKE